MIRELLTLGIVLAALVLLGAWEQLRHRRNLRRIPIRVHVNGMRGKSSVVRLIAGGLREGGIRTLAKTTGTAARLIGPDGTERPVARETATNVIEQVRVVSTAAATGVRALVIECMALQPALQAVCELQLVRSTHGVITNVGPDHLEIMGPTVHDAALALSATVPVGGSFYTAEQRHIEPLHAAALDRHSRLRRIDARDIEAIAPGDLAGFRYIEHPANVALALAVCTDLGVSRETALAGMWHARPDPGAMTVDRLHIDDVDLAFVNGFAANDPQSSATLWEMACRRFGEGARRIVLANCRDDRMLRSMQLGETIAHLKDVDHVVVMGRATFALVRRAVRAGVAPEGITALEGATHREVLEALVRLGARRCMVVGLGNTGAGGLAFVRFLRSHPGAEEDKPS